MKDLKNVAAIVTGGGSGLGEAAARSLADAGCKVALWDMDLKAAEKVANDIGGIAVKCDVSSEDSVAKALKASGDKNGIARIVVHCAGIGAAKKAVRKDDPSKALSLDEFNKVVSINAGGTFNVLKQLGTAMLDIDENSVEERGVMITTSSIAADDGQRGQVAYAASKGAVKSMTLPFARDLMSEKIRVMCIAPGIFDTKLLASLPPKAKTALEASVPFPSRLGKPEEFAELALAIVKNGMLNAETIRIDGALRMAP
jgi:NAD(P)-dependent dehydrogenase (short-subunit alcohol dehydrogenase family)